LYGTSYSQGTRGAAWKFTLKGEYTILHTFCLGPLCKDGSNPNSVLTQGSDGGLYGTTLLGGVRGNGTIFEITKTGGFHVLHSFCVSPCTEGYAPSSVVQNTSGLFYGVTAYGGPGDGALYSLSTGLGPFVKPTPSFGRAGFSVGILGNGLTGTTSVTFNGMPATFAVSSDTYIAAVIPTGAASGAIEVTTPGETLRSNVPFKVVP
jgi:uncharacterized repeat protein (TIGR03803 family)